MQKISNILASIIDAISSSLSIGTSSATSITIGKSGIVTTIPSTLNLSSLTASLPLQLDSNKNIISSASNLVTSLTGTSNNIVVSSNTGNVTISMSPTYTGGSSISSVGTITSGTWNGSNINAGYITINTNNLLNSAGALNTIQNIAINSSPRFSNLTIDYLLKASRFGLNTDPVSYTIMHIDGTQSVTDGFNSICTLINSTITLTTSSTFAKALEIRLNPSTSSGTISIATGIFIEAGTSSSNVTNGYGIYVDSINYGTNKYAAFFNGKVGIKISNPTTDLQLNADSASKPSTNTWQISSDKRIKSDPQDIDLDYALNTINALKIKSFSYIPEYRIQCQLPDKRKIGILADDLELVLPQCVSVSETDQTFGKTDTDEGITIKNLKSIQMDEVNYLLISAIQKLTDMVATLTARVINLEAKLN